MQTIAFGRFTLDTKRRALLVDGAKIELQSRPFDILAYLVAEHDRVVSRDEIVAHVWQGYRVAENNLTVQMSALRRALAEHGADGLIITVPGKGYRFVGELAPAAAAPREAPDDGPRGAPHTDLPQPHGPSARMVAPPEPAGRPRGGISVPWAGALVGVLLLGASIAAWRWATAPAPPPLSIAVLPFHNYSPDTLQDFLAEAISDDLTTDLSHIPGSVVIARESADMYRGRAVPTSEIGRELHVRYLLEGSVTRDEGEFHINAQLIEAATGAHLWAERFDTPMAHLAEARDAIVRRIASALDARLTDIAAAKPSPGRPDNADALTLFYRARRMTEQDDSLGGFEQAQRLLEQTIEQAPEFVDALAQLGLTLIVKIRSTDDPAEAADEARARWAIARALQVAPTNTTALEADARLRELDGNCGAAVISAGAVLAAEPNSIDALHVMAKCSFLEGQLDLSATYTETLLRLNPEGRRNKPRYMLLADVRLLQGRYREAIDLANQALAGEGEPAPGAANLDRADFSRLILIAATALSGDMVRAQALYAAHARIWPYQTTWRIAAYAPRKVADLPGYRKFLLALQAAGMPAAADEHTDQHVPPFRTPRDGGDFDPTPMAVPGAATIDTAQLAALLAHTQPLIIDLGRGAAVIHGAYYKPGVANGNALVDDALANHPDKDAAVVIMGSFAGGFTSYNGALRAVSLGYRHVLWYRGGEEAWAEAGNAAEDKRN